MKDYKLNFNQKSHTIQFLRKAGKDVFMGQMNANNAMWMIRNGRTTNNPIPHHEDFPICVDNEFWFPGEWKSENEQKDFSTEENSTEEISTEESSLGF